MKKRQGATAYENERGITMTDMETETMDDHVWVWKGNCYKWYRDWDNGRLHMKTKNEVLRII